MNLLDVRNRAAFLFNRIEKVGEEFLDVLIVGLVQHVETLLANGR